MGPNDGADEGDAVTAIDDKGNNVGALVVKKTMGPNASTAEAIGGFSPQPHQRVVLL